MTAVPRLLKGGKLRGNDPRAFERTYRDLYPVAYRTALLVTGNREDALDVAQETFVRLLLHSKKVEEVENLTAWVRKVAMNLSLSLLRRHRTAWRWRQRAVPAAQAEAPDKLVAIQSMLAILTPSQRAVVVLRYYFGFTSEETARELRKAPGTVRALTAQALTRLRQAEALQEVN